MSKELITNFRDHLKVSIQYLIPQHGLSRLVYHLARCKQPFIKNILIKAFIRCFNVDMSQTREPEVKAYSDFNQFFTRELKSVARPVTQEGIACPIDGTISQIGKINTTSIFQAKGRKYDLIELLAGDNDIAEQFNDGLFATLYLSPRDYHRIHMPLDGKLKKIIYVPGKLFAVNAHTTRVVDKLFARNERLICLFDTHIGPMAVIMVGAIFVGNMETVWTGQIIPAKQTGITSWSYNDQNGVIKLKRGEELGRFNMGSTAILLFRPDVIEWSPDACPDSEIIMGSCLGKLK